MSEKIILPGWIEKYHGQGYGVDELVYITMIMAKYTNETSAKHYLDKCLEISGKTKAEFLKHTLHSDEDKKRELALFLAEDLLDAGENVIMLQLLETVFTPRKKEDDGNNKLESIKELEL